MERETLLKEHKELVNTLLEKTQFIYSEEFYALTETEKQKYIKDKMATEGHLSTLSNLLWSETPQFNGLGDFFALGLISSMFGNGFSSSMPPSIESMKAKTDNGES